VYIADGGNARIRKVDATGQIGTFAGNGAYDGTNRFVYGGDGGPATQASFTSVYGVAADRFGNVYVADANNHRIRKVAPSGTITTFAGTGTDGFSGDGGPATAANLSYPYGVAVDDAGNVYIADTGNLRVRKVTGSGVISTIAGVGSFGFSGDGGPATAAQLTSPYAVAVDDTGSALHRRLPRPPGPQGERGDDLHVRWHRYRRLLG
jgi:hypothetical protein